MSVDCGYMYIVMFLFSLMYRDTQGSRTFCSAAAAEVYKGQANGRAMGASQEGQRRGMRALILPPLGPCLFYTPPTPRNYGEHRTPLYALKQKQREKQNIITHVHPNK